MSGRGMISQNAQYNTRLEDLLNRVYGADKNDEKRQQRNTNKELIKEPLEFLISNGISADKKYAQTYGIISRSYRASGGFGSSEFDVHLPLSLADYEISYRPNTLPQVKVEMKKKTQEWFNFIDGNQLSAGKIRSELHKSLSEAAAKWNKEKEEGKPGLEVSPIVYNTPMTATVTPGGDTEPVTFDIVPVIVTAGVAGTDDVKAKLKDPATGWSWPADDERRQELVNQLVIVPRGDGVAWLLSPTLACKTLIKMVNDGGETCREQVYRILKVINRKYWAPSKVDHESIKVGANVLQHVFINSLSKFPKDEQWAQEKLVDRYKGVVQDVRYAMSQGEFKETIVGGGGYNPLEVYKKGAFLTPKLGGLVRKVESTIKDPVSVLTEVLQK